MSIQSEISRISANVSDCYAIVKQTGVEVTVTTENSDNLSASIQSMVNEMNALLDEINGVEI